MSSAKSSRVSNPPQAPEHTASYQHLPTDLRGNGVFSQRALSSLCGSCLRSVESPARPVSSGTHVLGLASRWLFRTSPMEDSR